MIIVYFKLNFSSNLLLDLIWVLLYLIKKPFVGRNLLLRREITPSTQGCKRKKKYTQYTPHPGDNGLLPELLYLCLHGFCTTVRTRSSTHGWVGHLTTPVLCFRTKPDISSLCPHHYTITRKDFLFLDKSFRLVLVPTSVKVKSCRTNSRERLPISTVKTVVSVP